MIPPHSCCDERRYDDVGHSAILMSAPKIRAGISSSPPGTPSMLTRPHDGQYRNRVIAGDQHKNTRRPKAYRWIGFPNHGDEGRARACLWSLFTRARGRTFGEL